MSLSVCTSLSVCLCSQWTVGCHSWVTLRNTVHCCWRGLPSVCLWVCLSVCVCLYVSLSVCLSVCLWVSPCVYVVSEQSAVTAGWHWGTRSTAVDVGCRLSTQLWHDSRCWQFSVDAGCEEVWSTFCSTPCFPLPRHSASHRTFHWENCTFYSFITKALFDYK